MSAEIEAINGKLAWLHTAQHVDSLLLNWLAQAVCATGDKAHLQRLAQTVADIALNSDIQSAAIHQFQEIIALALRE